MMIGLMFLFIGKLMPGFRHNYFVGIKTPWTLANEEVWNETHIHGGRIWLVAGIMTTILSVIPGGLFGYGYFAVIIVAGLEPVIYSWVSFNKKMGK